jgi:hypothetical protein
MKHDSPTYRERVPASRLWRGGAALILPLLFWWHLTRHIQAVSGRSAAFFPSLVFIGVFTLLVYGILSLFYGVGIRLSSRRMLDGSRQPVLKIRGVTKGDRVDIPCRDIRDIRIISCRVPLWRTLLGPFGRPKVPGGRMIMLPGYRGNGLAVTYAFEGVFSGEVRETTILFPCRRCEELQALLRSEKAKDENREDVGCDHPKDRQDELV